MTITETMVFFASFGLSQEARAIISNKELYSRLLLFKTNVLSYISPFYHNFENFSFFNISTIFRPPRTGGKTSKFFKMNITLRIGPYKSIFLGGGPKGYVRYSNLLTPYLNHF